MLFLGTMFVPVEDRDERGMGFTHKPDDRVTIAAKRSARWKTASPERQGAAVDVRYR